MWDLEREAAGTYYLNMIAVSPAARGRGVGKELMREFLRQAAAHGFGAATLSTYESDAGLMAFYRQHGFEVTGRAAIPDHPAMELKGHWVLMRRGPPPGPAT